MNNYLLYSSFIRNTNETLVCYSTAQLHVIYFSRLCVAALALAVAVCARTQASSGPCERPRSGSVVAEPADLYSVNGELRVELTIRNFPAPDGSTRYCYVDQHGNSAPNLRLNPGDLLVLHLKNDLADIDHRRSAMPIHDRMSAAPPPGACSAAPMRASSTNLHFHGLAVPPLCHQDDVLNTSIGAGAAPFEYRFRIPMNQPPGLYWYHPHIHGFTTTQVLGGASGAMIIEGLEGATPQLAGLPERVLVIRDQDLLNPNSPPPKSEPVLPKMLIDRDGDAANTATGFGKPAKDLSINFVPVPYPDYPPAVIEMKPDERQLWRVLNASAVTYLNLAVLFGRTPQPLGLVALDGVPLNQNEASVEMPHWLTHLGVPPGGRVEFIVKAPPPGVPARFVTRTVDTGPGGENDPNRVLAAIEVSPSAREPRSTLAASPKPRVPSADAPLATVTPVRTRRLYFSEKLQDPNSPPSAVEFYITAEGQTPAPFDPHSTLPGIVARQGTVEDWIIENRSQELHAFHIHQLHFMLLDYLDIPVNEPFLRDTVNVPYLKDRALQYPSVRIRVDFRDPNAVGTFVYHCHLLEHEDGGMMGLIRVEPAAGDSSAQGRTASHPPAQPN